MIDDCLGFCVLGLFSFECFALVKRLAGKIMSETETTYSVSNGTFNPKLNSPKLWNYFTLFI